MASAHDSSQFRIPSARLMTSVFCLSPYSPPRLHRTSTPLPRRHVLSLTLFTASRLLALSHSNGVPVCELYGRHKWALEALGSSSNTSGSSSRSGSRPSGSRSSSSAGPRGESRSRSRSTSRAAVALRAGQGGTVALNLHRADGSWVGHREVRQLADLHGIRLRVREREGRW